YQAVYGRNGDAPMPVIASRSAADCFDVAIEAVRIAVQYMTPVMILTDGYIANAAEPWKVPDMSTYKPFPVKHHTELPAEGEKFLPYSRDEKLKRPWVKPGTPGLLHRIGGIEKAVDTGNLDYSPKNHQAMTDIRRDKVLGIDIPDQAVEVGQEGGKLVVVGWGSTYGPITTAVHRARAKGLDVSHVHIRHIWPMPKNLGDLLKSYEHILVPEMNTGQLKTVLRDQFLVNAVPLNKVSGQPFTIAEIEAAITRHLSSDKAEELAPDTTQLPSTEAVNP
ncbi:MAG: 2-oxoglutarate ferredoxin oxidoreductase subunit alpha, partial [Sphingomonadales bacterium]